MASKALFVLGVLMEAALLTSEAASRGLADVTYDKKANEADVQGEKYDVYPSGRGGYNGPGGDNKKANEAGIQGEKYGVYPSGRGGYNGPGGDDKKPNTVGVQDKKYGVNPNGRGGYNGHGSDDKKAKDAVGRYVSYGSLNPGSVPGGGGVPGRPYEPIPRGVYPGGGGGRYIPYGPLNPRSGGGGGGFYPGRPYESMPRGVYPGGGSVYPSGGGHPGHG